MPKKRIEYLDGIKGFSILLVVFCHNVLLPYDSILSNVLMIICNTAVPLFLMVSGVLLNSAKSFSWKKHLVKMGKIYIVLSVWKAICLIVTMLFSDVSFSTSQLINYLFFCGSIDNVTSISWYMEAFLMVLIFHPITYFILKKGDEGKTLFNYIVAVLFFASFGTAFVELMFAIIQKYFEIGVPSLWNMKYIFPFWQSSNIIFFFLFGTFLKINEDKLNFNIPERLKKFIPYICIAVGIIGLAAAKYAIFQTIRWDGIYIDMGYSRISTIILAYGFWNLFYEKENFVVKFLARFFGKYTMGIFYMHYIVLFVLSIGLYQYLWDYSSIGLNLLKTIVVASLCAVATKVISYIPVLKQLVK